MRRRGLRGLEPGEVAGRGEAVKGSVRPVMVVEVLEAVQQRIERLHGAGQLVDTVELVSPGAVAALHRAVELGSFGRQLVEGEAPGVAGVLELGLELRAAVDPRLRGGRLWIARTGKGIWASTLSKNRLTALAVAWPTALATVHLATGLYAVKCLIGLPGAKVMKTVSICTTAPGRSGLRPRGRRTAWRRRQLRRTMGLLRRRATGCTRPRSIRLFRMRPTVESDTSNPSALSSGPSLALPHIG